MQNQSQPLKAGACKRPTKLYQTWLRVSHLASEVVEAFEYMASLAYGGKEISDLEELRKYVGKKVAVHDPEYSKFGAEFVGILKVCDHVEGIIHVENSSSVIKISGISFLYGVRCRPLR